MAETFTVQLDAWIAQAKQKTDAFVRQFVQEAAEQIIVGTGDANYGGPGTPVDTGYARACWQAGYTVNVKFPLKGDGSDNAGDSGAPMPAPDVGLVTAQMAAGKTFYLLNNCEYIERLEYGHSSQAPVGMVRVTLAQADIIAKGVLAMLGGKGK